VPRITWYKRPTAGAFTVNLSATTRTLSLEWLNPSNAALPRAKQLREGRPNQSFTPPFSGDAVLYLVDTVGHS